MSVLALIPARSGSKGIPGKNLRTLGGKTLIQLAVECALEADCHPVVSTDIPELLELPPPECLYDICPILRPHTLAQDDTPMIDVVKHALEQIPGPPDQIIVLVQPTQPFRTPAHVKQAIELLQSSGADSVVSVVELPRTHSPNVQMSIDEEAGDLWPWRYDWDSLPACRQEHELTYIRDGTVYAFWRKTVEQYGTIYGNDVRPLIIPPDESCELDTESDWDAVWQRYYRKLHHHADKLEKCPTCGMCTWVRA